jgi:hypothetical protein
MPRAFSFFHFVSYTVLLCFRVFPSLFGFVLNLLVIRKVQFSEWVYTKHTRKEQDILMHVLPLVHVHHQRY